MLDCQYHAANDEALAKFELFASLAEGERKRYLSRLNWYRVRAGEQVVDREAGGRNVFFVREGLVRVVSYCQSGRQISFEDIGPGGFFGELSAIDGKSRSASVVAVEETRLASMSAEVFIPIVTTHPEVALALMKRLASMVRQASKRVVEVSTLAAQSRVNAELLRLASAHQTECNAAVIRPAPVHSELASRVSTTRETVARVMNAHVRSGLIARRRGALVINDIERLAAMVAEFATP